MMDSGRVHLGIGMNSPAPTACWPMAIVTSVPACWPLASAGRADVDTRQTSGADNRITGQCDNIMPPLRGIKHKTENNNLSAVASARKQRMIYFINDIWKFWLLKRLYFVLLYDKWALKYKHVNCYASGPFVRYQVSVYTRYSEDEWTEVDTNWHKWSGPRGEDIKRSTSGVRRSRVKVHKAEVRFVDLAEHHCRLTF